jgi:uncharacterized protein YggE
MKSFLILFAAVLFAGHTCYAQAAGNYLYNNPHSFNNERANIPVNMPNGNGVTLKAEVMMNVKATSYTAIFAATQAGPDAPTVDSIMTLRMELIRMGLALLGISDKDIHIDAVSMVPTYSYKIEEKKFSKRATEIPIGFEMKKNIHVLFREHHLLDGIISQMALADVYDMVKVEYNIDGSQTYLDELRNAALSVIDTKKKIYPSLGMHLTVASLSDGFQITYPMERYKSFTAANSGTSFHQLQAFAGSHSNSVSVTGTNNTVRIDGAAQRDYLQQQFLIQTSEKNKTIFYDRIPYNQFDKVINADTEEPCIQLYYTLVVTYTMMTQEQHEQIEKNKKISEEAMLIPGKKKKKGK